MTLQDLLVFFTGAENEPPLGFTPKPSLTFLHHLSDILPTASTCSLQLRLPTRLSYDAFRDGMINALKGHGGFGLV